MGRPRKVIRICAMVLSGLLVIAAALLWFLPTLIDSGPFKNGIITHLTERLGAPPQFSRLTLAYFPRPRLTIFDCRATITAGGMGKGAAKGTARVSKIIVYPRLRPLLFGKIILARIEVIVPEVQWETDWDRTAPAESSSSASPSESAKTDNLHERLIAIAATFPATRIVVRDGRLSLKAGDNSALAVEQVQLDLFDGGKRLTASGSSDFCEALQLAAGLNPGKQKGRGTLKLQYFRPHRLIRFLSSDAENTFTDSSADLTADLDWHQTVLQARLKGSAPILSFSRKGRSEAMVLQNLDAAYRLKGAQHTLTLNSAVFDSPPVAFSAEFGIDTANPANKSGLVAQINSSQVEIEPLRQVALSLGGDLKAVKHLFEVLKRGRVTDFQVSSHGATFAELAIWNHLRIGGNLRDGAITLPTLKWNLDEVSGRADISDGLLAGSELTARYDTAVGRKGELKIGLAPGSDRFHLNIEISTAVKQIRQVLNRLAPSPALSAVVDEFTALKGTVQGTLVLGETFENLTVRVSTGELNISGRHARLPFPFEIKGGRFQYQNDEIALLQLNGSLNRSRFSNLTTRLGLKAPASIKRLNGNFDFQLSELAPWWSRVGRGTAMPGGLTKLSGSARLAVNSLTGPLSAPSKWLLKVGAEAQQIQFTSPHLPAPVTIVSGHFGLQTSADDVAVAIKDTRLKLIDADLKLSGQLTGRINRLHSSHLQVSGVAGGKAVDWLFGVLDIKNLIKPQPVNITKGGLIWRRNGPTTFRGDLSLKDSTKLSGEVRRAGRRLSITNLVVQNSTSQATMALDLSPRQVDLNFNGSLDAAIVKRVLTATPLEAGNRHHASSEQPGE